MADQFVSEDKYEEAILCLTEALKRTSENIPVSYFKSRADCYLKLRNLDSAIDDLRQAVSMAPNEMSYKLALVDSLTEAGLIDEAVQEIMNTENSGNYLASLGNRMLSAEKCEAAILCYTAAIDKEPEENFGWYMKRGTCYLRQHELDLAVRDLKKAITMEPDLHNPRLLLIEASLDKEDFDEAVLQMEVITDIELSELADDLVEKHKLKQALFCCDGAIKKDPHDEFYYQRGQINEKMGDLKTAIHDMSKALELDPEFLKCRLELIKILIAVEEYEEAKKVIEHFNGKSLGLADRQMVEKFREEINVGLEKKGLEVLEEINTAVKKESDESSQENDTIPKAEVE